MLIFGIPGEPVPWRPARVTRRGTFKPSRSRQWLDRAVVYIRSSREMPRVAIEGPVAISITVVMGRPKRPKPPLPPERAPFTKQKGDLTNIVKLAEDALERAGVIRNDAQVVRQVNEHWYAAQVDDPPGVLITVESIA